MKTTTDGKLDLEMAIIRLDLAESGCSSAASRAQRLAELSLGAQREALEKREAELASQQRLGREQKKLQARAARLARREAVAEARRRYWAPSPVAP